MAVIPVSQTEANLLRALVSETLASRRYKAFATASETEGHEHAAVILHSLAQRRAGHAEEHLRMLDGLADALTDRSTGDVRGDLCAAIANERDEIGPDLVPDYLTSVQDGGFYGWPYSYYGQHLDPRVEPQRPDLVAKAIAPDYALSSHVAPLGLAFYTATSLPESYRGGAFVGEHGSWNRDVLNGYKVVFVPFTDGKPSGKAQDVVTGFLNNDGQSRGRPVGLAVDKSGALLIADDVGNTVWRVTGGPQASASR